MVEAIFTTIAGLGTVFGWAFFSFWSAIPAGIALNISPILIMLTVTLSYGAGVVLVVLAGTPLRERIRRRMEAKSSMKADDETDQPTESRMILLVRGAWARYGLIGLAILAPMTVGAQIGAVIGLSLGVPSLRLTIAMTLGAGVWAIGITLAIVGGVMTVSQI